jgi:hypothetical protein
MAPRTPLCDPEMTSTDAFRENRTPGITHPDSHVSTVFESTLTAANISVQNDERSHAGPLASD